VWQSVAVATMADLDQLAMAMPQTTREEADGRPRYLVHGKLYCCHRGRRPDAVDPDTGERMDDVLMFRVADVGVKELLLADDRGVFFTTPHFDGYPAADADPRPRPHRSRGAGRRDRRGLADAGAEACGQGLARAAGAAMISLAAADLCW
jgi:hypothetical protein